MHSASMGLESRNDLYVNVMVIFDNHSNIIAIDTLLPTSVRTKAAYTSGIFLCL